MFKYYNPHPQKKIVGDCAIRALSKALNKTWDEIYIDLAVEGFCMCDLPNADVVWGNYLVRHGFTRYLIPDDSFGAYTIGDFANDHPTGVYVVSVPGQHVVTIVDSVVYDSWDCQNEIPSYFYKKK